MQCGVKWQVPVVDAARPWMLALDTSNQIASIALAPVGQEDAGIGAEVTWDAGRRQTTTVLNQVDHLMRLAGIENEALGAVAIAIGPGSFNALRVGMSVAKGLAFALDIPIFGVGTLDAAALSVSLAGKPVRAFLDAGRSRVVSGDYRFGPNGLELRGPLVHRTLDDLAEGLIEPTVFAGELTEAARKRLRGEQHVILPWPAQSRRRASMLLDIAARRWQNGDADDLLALEPVYVHSQPAAATTERHL